MAALHCSCPFRSNLINFKTHCSTAKPTPPRAKQLKMSSAWNFYQSHKVQKAYTSVLIVPTGIGASIGGFAGDALPVARTLSSVVDCLISHPNQCFIGQCRMFYMLKAMLLTALQKAYGHYNLFTKTGCVSSSSPFI